MKDVLMFVTSWCPHCKKAISMLEQVRGEEEAFGGVEIVMIDEEREKKYADSFDYYRVPTFYVDGVKVHEGAVSLENIRQVFKQACQQ
jgi:thiol-disulfide isomerase/thioredoxin